MGEYLETLALVLVTNFDLVVLTFRPFFSLFGEWMLHWRSPMWRLVHGERDS